MKVSSTDEVLWPKPKTKFKNRGCISIDEQMNLNISGKIFIRLQEFFRFMMLDAVSYRTQAGILHEQNTDIVFNQALLSLFSYTLQSQVDEFSYLPAALQIFQAGEP